MKYKAVQIFSLIQFEVHDNSHLLPHRGQSTSKKQPKDSNKEYNPHKDAKVTKPPKKTKGIIPSDRTKMTQVKITLYTVISYLMESI